MYLVSKTVLVAALSVTVCMGSANATPMQSAEPAAAVAAGLEAIRDEEFIAASNIFEQALLAKPQDLALNRHLGIAYYKTGRTEQAIEQLENTLALSLEDVETHYALGVAYLERASEVGALKVRGVLKDAIHHLGKAIELDSNHIAARYYLIQILINAPKMMGGDQQRAEALNEQLAELSPLHHRMVNSTLASEQEDHEGAERLLLESHKAHPESTLVNFAMLSYYHDREQYEKAVDFGESFLSLPKTWDDTALSSAHLLLAQAYAQLGKQQQSHHHYALTLTHTDNKKLIKRVQKEVAKLTKDSESSVSPSQK